MDEARGSGMGRLELVLAGDDLAQKLVVHDGQRVLMGRHTGCFLPVFF